MDISNLDSQTIIFGGLTLVSLALISLFYKFLSNHTQHTNDVIERNTKAWLENSKTNQYLSDTIVRWHIKNKKK